MACTVHHFGDVTIVDARQALDAVQRQVLAIIQQFLESRK